MEKTLQQLGQILLNGIPTFVLVLLLNVYLRFVFFKPLEKVMDERYQVTDGARKAASEALAAADRRISEYQLALRRARAEVYEAQEKLNRQLEEEQAAAIQAAHQAAEVTMKSARASLIAETEAARKDLDVRSDSLAEEIAGILLKGKAA